MTKEKVYCDECRHFVTLNKVGGERCNIRDPDSGDYRSRSPLFLSPRTQNHHNNCELYEPKQNAWEWVVDNWKSLDYR
jgi:hypothetical protein